MFIVILDYLHGTGHGIGAFLSVHESPTYIGIGGTRENRFREDYFFSDGLRLIINRIITVK